MKERQTFGHCKCYWCGNSTTNYLVDEDGYKIWCCDDPACREGIYRILRAEI